jgi:hypothetical protein
MCSKSPSLRPTNTLEFDRAAPDVEQVQEPELASHYFCLVTNCSAHQCYNLVTIYVQKVTELMPCLHTILTCVATLLPAFLNIIKSTLYTVFYKVLKATPTMNVFWQTVNICASSHQGVDPKCSNVRIKTYWHMVTCVNSIVMCQ